MAKELLKVVILWVAVCNAVGLYVFVIFPSCLWPFVLMLSKYIYIDYEFKRADRVLSNLVFSGQELNRLMLVL